MAPSLKKTRLRNEISFERSQLNRADVVNDLQRQLHELENEENENNQKGGTSP